ncbi:Chaperone protein DnaJ [Mycobacteroides abscessus]|nr:Chaperone protein DnaJ [Mycobacteroides abscessus]
MTQREWVEKDFYKELGVSSTATQDEIKKAARKLLAENHPDRNPGNQAAEDRYKAVSEAKDVLSDPAKRKEYDETRRLFAGGGFGRRFGDNGFGGGGGFSGGSNSAEFNLNDLFAMPTPPAGVASATCSVACSGSVRNHAPAGRAAETTWKPRLNSTS